VVFREGPDVKGGFTRKRGAVTLRNLMTYSEGMVIVRDKQNKEEFEENDRGKKRKRRPAKKTPKHDQVKEHQR